MNKCFSFTLSETWCILFYVNHHTIFTLKKSENNDIFTNVKDLMSRVIQFKYR